MGDGDASPEPGAAKLLTLGDARQHGLMVETIDRSEPSREAVQDDVLAVRVEGDDSLGRQRKKPTHCVSDT